MPQVERMFHYRSFDINSLYIFFEVDKDRNRVESHRAKEDIERDIAQLQRFRGYYHKALGLSEAYEAKDNLP
jgi:oligoribonuclease (3'-5' exoribonuclease)